MLTRMRRFAALLLCATAANAYAVGLQEHRVEDLDYGRALFEFYQDKELDAITRLLIAEESPRTRRQVDEAHLLLADLYYGYGLYEESRQMFARLLSAEVSDSVQNRIWFNLARLRYDQGYYDHALELLSRINAELTVGMEAERKYLLTSLLLGNREYDQAADLSNRIESDSIWRIYARYNLAVSMIEDDRFEQGRVLLDKLGQLEPTSAELVALRDRANLSLGLKLLRLEQPKAALESLSRVRLEGPLSNEALLATGWAWYQLDNFKKAQVYWQYLLQRNAVDAATQEAILAIPSNYASAGQDRLAIRNYEVAAKQFDAQLRLLDGAVESIENNELIAALGEHAILHDRGNLQRMPPSSDVTPQLHLLLASTEFQREIKRYQDLLDIRHSLRYWGNSFPALELMLEERRQAFQQKLPKLRQSASLEQVDVLRSRRDRLAAQVDAIEAGEDYAALASSDEKDNLERLERVAARIDKLSPQQDMGYQRDMLRLLSGLLRYELATDYPARFWKVKKQLIGLDRALEEANARVAGLRRITERTDLEFGVFEARISGQQDRIRGLRRQVGELLGKQERLINRMAIDEIRAQQQHVVKLRLNARFELAKLYDRLAATND